jgi:hypothetical protein
MAPTGQLAFTIDGSGNPLFDPRGN